MREKTEKSKIHSTNKQQYIRNTNKINIWCEYEMKEKSEKKTKSISHYNKQQYLYLW